MIKFYSVAVIYSDGICGKIDIAAYSHSGAVKRAAECCNVAGWQGADLSNPRVIPWPNGTRMNIEVCQLIASRYLPSKPYGDVSAAINSMLECALWSASDEKVQNSSIFDCHLVTLEQLATGLAKFWADNMGFADEFIEQECVTQFGHSYWLSLNGHGAGFFDFGGVGDTLQKLVGRKEHDLYVNRNGKVCL